MITGVSLQTFFSIQHVRAAAHFARRASELEGSYDGTLTSPLLAAIQANVTGALLSSVAFLEATANELFADAAEPNGGHLRGLDTRTLSRIARLGATKAVARAQLPEKYEILLLAADRDPLDAGARPAQDVAILIRLRNVVVHYDPAWLDAGTEGMVRPGSLAKSSLGEEVQRRFAPRAHAAPSSSDAWMGCSCAKWATESSVAYADAVFNRLGVTPIFNHVRSDLSFD